MSAAAGRVRPERQTVPGDLRNGESDDRRNQEQGPIGRRWNDGFLKEYLRAISKTLKQTKRPDHIGAPAQCHRCPRSEEHTSELQSLMRISYAVFCLKKKTKKKNTKRQYICSIDTCKTKET